MKKILLIPPMNGWYMEAHAEYLIRHLNSTGKFQIEVADVPYPPYENFLDRFPETNPFQRNPDDYDLIVPLLATHWVVTDKDKYRKKTALIWYQPNEGGYYDDLAGIAATTPLAEQSLLGKRFHSLRFGIDTDLFKPLGFEKEKGVLRVGMVGNLYNPRRMTKTVINSLRGLSGVKLMLYPSQPPKSAHDMELLSGGSEGMQYIVSGSKYWTGLPNVYNSLDVLIRCDSDPGYSFPVLEAAACGIPVIATNSGIDHEITEEGGILIDGDREYYLNNEEEVGKKVRDAVIYLRDHANERLIKGINARQTAVWNYRWEKHIDKWEVFFEEALKNASAV